MYITRFMFLVLYFCILDNTFAQKCTPVSVKNLTSEKAVFAAINKINVPKFDPTDLSALGEVDPIDPNKSIKKYSIKSGLKVVPVGTELAILKANSYSFNPDFLSSSAAEILKKQNADISAVGAADSKGLYTVPLMKAWLLSLDDSELYKKARERRFAGLRVLKREELSSIHQKSLESSSNKCSHFLAVTGASQKSLKCVNYSASVVSCETGKAGYVCLKNSIPEKIAAEIKLIVKTSANTLPIKKWVDSLNKLQESSNDTNRNVIKKHMLFYKSTKDEIRCAVEVSEAFKQVAKVANLDSKNYIKVPVKDCGDLYRMATFNPKYAAIPLRKVPKDFLKDIDKTSHQGARDSSRLEDPIVDLGLTKQFDLVKNASIRYSLNHFKSIPSFTSNMKFVMNPSVKTVFPSRLELPPATCTAPSSRKSSSSSKSKSKSKSKS